MKLIFSAFLLCATSSTEPPRPVAEDYSDTHDRQSDTGDKLKDVPDGIHQLNQNLRVYEEVQNNKHGNGSDEPVAVIHEVAKELIHVYQS